MYAAILDVPFEQADTAHFLHLQQFFAFSALWQCGRLLHASPAEDALGMGHGLELAEGDAGRSRSPSRKAAERCDRRLEAFVEGEHRHNPQAFEPDIGAQEIVGPVFEGDVLNPRVAAFVGIGGEAGYLEEDDAVIHLVHVSAQGMLTWKLVPPPTVLSTQMRPLWASTIPLQIANPSPALARDA